MARPAKVFTLYRYFIVADQMRRLYYEYLQSHPGVTVDSDEWIESYVYMSLWYGTLYVVTEGWRRLGLSDSQIERHLVDTAMVQRLESARNGAFHFKSKYWDVAQTAMPFGGAESARWVAGLHKAYSRYFLDWAETQRST